MMPGDGETILFTIRNVVRVDSFEGNLGRRLLVSIENEDCPLSLSLSLSLFLWRVVCQYVNPTNFSSQILRVSEFRPVSFEYSR